MSLETPSHLRHEWTVQTTLMILEIPYFYGSNELYKPYSWTWKSPHFYDTNELYTLVRYDPGNHLSSTLILDCTNYTDKPVNPPHLYTTIGLHKPPHTFTLEIITPLRYEWTVQTILMILEIPLFLHYELTTQNILLNMETPSPLRYEWTVYTILNLEISSSLNDELIDEPRNPLTLTLRINCTKNTDEPGNLLFSTRQMDCANHTENLTLLRYEWTVYTILIWSWKSPHLYDTIELNKLC